MANIRARELPGPEQYYWQQVSPSHVIPKQAIVLSQGYQGISVYAACDQVDIGGLATG